MNLLACNGQGNLNCNNLSPSHYFGISQSRMTCRLEWKNIAQISCFTHCFIVLSLIMIILAPSSSLPHVSSPLLLYLMHNGRKFSIHWIKAATVCTLISEEVSLNSVHLLLSRDKWYVSPNWMLFNICVMHICIPMTFLLLLPHVLAIILSPWSSRSSLSLLGCSCGPHLLQAKVLTLYCQFKGEMLTPFLKWNLPQFHYWIFWG